MPHALNDFNPCGAGETVARAFVFSNALAVGETLIGVPTCTISVLSGGVDPSPQSRLVGGPTVNPAGNQVGLLFGGGGLVAGVTYQILIVATTSSNQTLDCFAYQQVLTA